MLTYNDFGEAEGSARSQAEEEDEVVAGRAVCGDERGKDGRRKAVLLVVFWDVKRKLQSQGGPWSMMLLLLDSRIQDISR